MLKYEDIVNYSMEFNIPVIDVLFIALNRYGVNLGDVEDRMRFVLSPKMYDEDFFFALPVNTTKSPFTIKNDILFMDDVEIGNVSNAERDTCSETYFRKNKTAMTLNSNSRSTCAGCRFCGTYKLSSEEKENFSAEGEVVSFISDLLKENNLSDLKNMESITVCTGCFKTEEFFDNFDILKLQEEYNFKDVCVERRNLKEKAFTKIKNKYKEEDKHSSRMLLSILGVRNIDDDWFNYRPSGSISVNSYGQLKIEEIDQKYLTVFAHPTESKLDVVNEIIKSTGISAIEINMRILANYMI